MSSDNQEMDQSNENDLDLSTTSDTTPTKPQETTIESVQRCVESLVHAGKCLDVNCVLGLPTCQKSKRLIRHTQTCRIRATNGGCITCKQFFDLCSYHSRHCKEVECPAAFCPSLKEKFHIPKPRSLQGPLIRRRRIAMIKTLVSDPEKDSRVVSYPLVVSNNGKTISRQFFIKNKDQTQGKIDFPRIIEQQRNKRLRQEKVQQLLQELRQRKADLEASGSVVELNDVDTPKQEG